MRQYLRDVVLGFWSIILSMKITLRYLFTRAVTVQYPEEKRQLPTRALTQHVLTILNFRFNKFGPYWNCSSGSRK